LLTLIKDHLSPEFIKRNGGSTCLGRVRGVSCAAKILEKLTPIKDNEPLRYSYFVYGRRTGFGFAVRSCR
jgi:hypothetical protein